MRRFILALALAALPGAALADTYPVSGRFAVGSFPPGEPVACAGQRVIAFFDSQRTDTGGGAPGFHNRWIARVGEGRYRVSDWFSTGQIHAGQLLYELRILDADRLQMIPDRSGPLSLQRCQ